MRQPRKRTWGLPRPALACLPACLATLLLLVADVGPVSAAATHMTRPQAGQALADEAAQIDTLIRSAMREHDLNAVIVQVTVAGRPVITKAYGGSMTGVPATTSMHFRNGAVAISYMSTLLLRLVDEHKVSLDDPVSLWLPWLRDAHQVTLRMLAGMSSGYYDYEQSPRLTAELDADPFRNVTTGEQLQLALSHRQLYKPGTNWSYAHTNYVILGLILQQITHEPLDVALREQVLVPLDLTSTTASQTAAIPEPVLHAYTAERRQFLGIKPSIPFLEDSTYWNPSWTLAAGAVETTDITDMTRTAIGIGGGLLLSRSSYAEQINPRIGFGHPQPGCATCRTLNRVFGYGLGVVRNGSWILQNPLFGGYSAVEAYLPSQKISIAVAATFGEGSFDAQGNPQNWATTLYGQIGAVLAPNDPPPAQ